MPDIGYALSSEEFGPSELVNYGVVAEQTGFDFVSVSDHFHPWTTTQGESPFVWNTLGGLAEATDEVDLGVGVSVPAFRMHPAIYAQAAATTKAQLDGREFYFGVGSGENLNEHIFGEGWPEHEIRLDMLREAIEVIRKLWGGGQTSHHGEYFDLQNATIFTLPDELPPIVVSAFGEQTANVAGQFGEGLWTVGPQDDLLDAYEETDPDGDGPKIAQISACYAESEDEAVQTVLEHWPQGALPGELNQILPTPRHFEQASQMVTEEDIREGSTITAPDADEHVDSIQQAVDAGFDHVYVHQIGPDQGSFFDFYESEVLPSFD